MLILNVEFKQIRGLKTILSLEFNFTCNFMYLHSVRFNNFKNKL